MVGGTSQGLRKQQAVDSCLQNLVLNLFQLPLVVCRLYNKLVALLLQVWPFLGHHHSCTHKMNAISSVTTVCT